MMMKNEVLYQVTAPHFCAGIIVIDNIVIKAAPILRWMIDKNVDYLTEYCKKKKWEICRVKN